MWKKGWPPLLVAIFMMAAFTGTGVAQEQEAQGDWRMEDTEGDAGLFGPFVVPGTENQGAAADIHALRIQDEDITGFTLVFELGSVALGEPSLQVFGSDAYYRAMFTLEDSPLDYTVMVQGWNLAWDPAAAEPVMLDEDSMYAEICTRISGSFCEYYSLDFVLDEEADEIQVRIPKNRLLPGGHVIAPPGGGGGGGGDGEPVQVPSSINAGDRLVDFSAYSGIFLNGISYGDNAPDGEQPVPFTFTTGMANGIVRLDLEGWNTLSVLPGTNQSVKLFVSNLAAGKRLVQFEYGFKGDPQGAQVFGPPSIKIPGGETRNVTLKLDLPANFDFEQDVSLYVKSTSLGQADEIGYSQRLLDAGFILGPNANTLYFHEQRFSTTGSAQLDEVWCDFSWCSEGLLSAWPDDERAYEGKRIPPSWSNTGLSESQETFWLYLWDQPGQPIAFDRNEEIEVDVTLEPFLDFPNANVRVTIQYTTADESGVLFDESEQATLKPSGTTLTFKGPVRAPEDREGIAIVDDSLGLWMAVVVESALPSPQIMTQFTQDTQIVADKSQIRFPLLPLPEDLLQPELDGALQISSGTGLEDFVNPGEGRLFNLTILNQDVLAHRADVTFESLLPGWAVQVMPGQVFDLEAGDSVNVGVLVTAPTGAAEGEIGMVRINATDDNDVSTGLVLRVTATSGIDLPDDTGKFQADEEDTRKLAINERKGTPGPAALSLLAVLGIGAALVRRRRNA